MCVCYAARATLTTRNPSATARKWEKDAMIKGTKTKKELKSIRKEVELGKDFKHPNIVTQYGFEEILNDKLLIL